MSERIDGWERAGGDFASWECHDGLWAGSSVTFERNAYEKHPWLTVADRNDYAATTIPLSVLRALLAEHGFHIITKAELQALTSDAVMDVCRDELARRAQKPEGS